MPDIRLPNGVIIRGVPEGTSKEQVMQKAISKGLATTEDFPFLAAQSPAVVDPSISSPATARPSFPDGYKGRIGEMRAVSPQEALRQERLTGVPAAIGRAFESVATLGQAPKIRAFAAGMLPGREYETELARELGERQITQEAQPFAYEATQALAPVGLLGRAAGPSRFVGQGIVAPAVESAISGAAIAGEKMASPQEMAKEGLKSAAIGGALGPIGYAVGRSYKFIEDLASRKSRKAQEIIKRDLDTNVTPEEARRILDLGENQAMIADVVPETAYAVAAQPGRSKQIVKEALERRQKGDPVTGGGGQKEQLKDILQDFTGKWDENFYNKLQNHREERFAKGVEAYDKAFEDLVKPTDEMVKISKTPTGSAALNRAKNTYLDEMMVDEFPYDKVEDIDDMKFWNMYKKELGSAASHTPEGQPIFKEADRTPQNRAAARMEKKIRDSLGDQSKAYDEAVKENQIFQRQDEAMRVGKNIYRLKTDEIPTTFKDLPEEYLMSGIIQAIKEKLDDVMDTADIARRITRTDRFKSVLKQAIPDKKKYAEFLKKIQRLEQQAYTFSRVTRTVPTASNIVALERAAQQPGPLADIVGLNLGQAMRGAAGMVRPGANIPYEDMARLLTLQGPEAIRALEDIYTPVDVIPGAPGLLGLGVGYGGQQLTQ